MDQATHDLLVKFVYLFLSAAMPVLVGYLVALLDKQVKLAKAKLQAEQPAIYAQLDAIIKMGVFAAEQAGMNGWIEDKKEYALGIIQKELDARGFSGFDAAQLEAKLEAAVFEQLNKDKSQG